MPFAPSRVLLFLVVRPGAVASLLLVAMRGHSRQFWESDRVTESDPWTMFVSRLSGRFLLLEAMDLLLIAMHLATSSFLLLVYSSNALVTVTY